MEALVWICFKITNPLRSVKMIRTEIYEDRYIYNWFKLRKRSYPMAAGKDLSFKRGDGSV
jgi:hypothetical protein